LFKKKNKVGVADRDFIESQKSEKLQDTDDLNIPMEYNKASKIVILTV
jgi:hypothetical protein